MEQGREKIHATRRTLYTPALLMAAAVLVACATALLAVSQKAESVLPGKNGRIDLSRDVSVPKRCEAGGSSVCRGTQYDDHITGTPNDDTIKALEGWDDIRGHDGDDTAFGGPGTESSKTISTARRAATPSSVALGRTASTPPKARTKCRRVTVTTGYTPLTMGQQTGSLAARVTIGSYLAKRTTSPKTARSRAPLVGHHNPGVKGVTWHRSAATPAHFMPLFTEVTLLWSSGVVSGADLGLLSWTRR